MNLPINVRVQSEVLLQGLLAQELELAERNSALDKARAEFDLVSHQYSAIRDRFMELTGDSPYSPDSGWKPDVDDPEFRLGRFRFIYMQIGEAIKQVLKEASDPLALSQIGLLLIFGSLSASSRAVNAALMQLGGVEKTEDGKYSYIPDDLPF